MPQRVYCARCGAERVARHCTGCGADVDRQLKKLIHTLVRYTVQGTEQPRKDLASASQTQRELRLGQLTEAQRQRLEHKLAALERNHLMEIVEQRRLMARLTPPLPPPPNPQASQHPPNRHDNWAR